jgi:signal transduction histidine kinase
VGDRTPVALVPVVGEHVAAWTALYARHGRRIAVHVDGPGAGDVRALASRGTIGQVLDVLLDNALRHGGGEVTLRVGQDARFAVVTVEDQGPGVAATALTDIFARGATSAGSTGIGLHLARTLARADGGSLRLTQARPPRFELRLRLARGAESD